MLTDLPLFPQQASTGAARVDALFLFLMVVSVFFASLIFFLILYFAIKYRRRSEAEQPRPIFGDLRLEVLWTVIPLGLTMIMFVWGARLYFTTATPPADALEITVVGKQWMWKFQHPEGQREINELHVPVGQPFRMVLTSEDVIHSFFVPDFRLHMDVLPGRYTSTWFQATRPGTYHLFCSQYCGTNHAGMIGQVVVMEQTEYQAWLQLRAEGSLALEGRKVFLKYRCASCHSADENARAPVLEGLYGKTVAYRLPGESART